MTETTSPEESSSEIIEETAESSANIEQGKTSSEGTYQDIVDPIEVSIKSLLDAGAHYGHQSFRWNPKMLPFIYGERNGIHIINLDSTMKAWERARKYIVDRLSMGGNILFVGTKQQGRDIIKEEAIRCGGYFVCTRWLGGTLTNFETLKNSIARMKKLEDLYTNSQVEGSGVKLAKKERLNVQRQIEKLDNNLGGIRFMRRLPDVVFVTDINKEDIAIAEARKLRIPIVALVDTNVDPNIVDFPIPSNDDSARTLRLFAGAVADAVIEGKKIFDSRSAKIESIQSSSGKEATFVKREHKGGSSHGPRPEHA